MANTKSAAAPPQPSGAHPAPTPSVPTPAVPTPAKPVETAVIVQPQPAHEVASVHTVAATESDEYPDYQPENASADPACRLFFSAYGISPAQAKWIAQNRKKQFSSICPAPDVSRVDYVIIFTHDVDFFGSTLPTPVHTDHNGFSDFSPMTMIDTALVPMSEADKSHREYVWVFKMQRGNFDPGEIFTAETSAIHEDGVSRSYADRRGSLPLYREWRPEPVIGILPAILARYRRGGRAALARAQSLFAHTYREEDSKQSNCDCRPDFTGSAKWRRGANEWKWRRGMAGATSASRLH